jgi:hypothetical protein
LAPGRAQEACRLERGAGRRDPVHRRCHGDDGRRR